MLRLAIVRNGLSDGVEMYKNLNAEKDFYKRIDGVFWATKPSGRIKEVVPDGTKIEIYNYKPLARKDEPDVLFTTCEQGCESCHYKTAIEALSEAVRPYDSFSSGLHIVSIERLPPVSFIGFQLKATKEVWADKNGNQYVSVTARDSYGKIIRRLS